MQFLFYLLPYREFKLQCHLSMDEVRRRLTSELNAPMRRLKFLGFADGKFRGTVTGNNFVISRNIAYRNSFLPVVSGTIIASAKGCVITGTMEMGTWVRVLLRIWLALVGFGSVVAIVASQGPLTAAGMFFAGLGLSWAGFYPESQMAKMFLCATLSAEDA